MRQWGGSILAVGLAAGVGFATPAWARQAAEAEDPPAVVCGENFTPGPQAVVDACTADMAFWPADDTAFQAWARIRRANALIRLGRTEAALADLDAALVLDPTASAAFMVRGQLKAGKGDTAGALSDLDKAVDLKPSFTNAVLARAGLHMRLGDYDRAAADASRVIAQSTGTPPVNAYYILGYARMRTGDIARAITDVSDGLRRMPNDDRLLKLRAIGYGATEDYDKAIADLTAVIDRNPGDVEALFQRAVMHQQSERPKEAIADLTTTLRLKPDHPWAYQNRSFIYAAMGETDLALADADALIARPPDKVIGLNQRGYILTEAGRLTEARAAYDASLAIRPTAAAFGGRAETWSKAEDDKRLADLTRALELDPGVPQALGARARIYAGRKQYDLALADAAEALGKDPKQSDALQAQITAFDAQDNNPGLLKALDTLITIAAPNAGLFNLRCWTLATSGGDLEKALADCEQAVKLSGGRAAYVDSRAMVHLQAGRYDEAIADYDRALKADPQMASALYGRGIARLRRNLTPEGRADLAAATAIDAGIAARFATFRLRP